MKKYYIARNGKQIGYFDIEEIEHRIGAAKLIFTDFIFDEVSNDWVLLMAHKDINSYFNLKKPKFTPVSNGVGASELFEQEGEGSLELLDIPALPEKNILASETELNLQAESLQDSSIESNKVDLAKYSDELVSGPVTSSSFHDLLEEEILSAEEKPSPSFSQEATDIEVELDDIDSDTLEVPEEVLSELKKEGSAASFGFNKKDSVNEEEKQESSVDINTAFNYVVPDNAYHDKIEKIKSEKGSTREKALKITRALEEVTDPVVSEWYVLKDDNKYGPYTYKDMLNMLDEKFIYRYDFAWHSTLSNWRRIAELDAFGAETVNKLKDTYMPELTKTYFKRRHKRVNYGHSIMIHDNDKIWKGNSVQIGEGGVGVVMDKAHISPGQTLYLHFKPGDGVPPFNATCEVVSKDPQQNLETKKLEVLYGMKFIHISSDVSGLVNSIKESKKVV